MTAVQDDRVHWNGQPIAVVLAETQERADHATSLIRVAYEEDDAENDFSWTTEVDH
jgi:xanthine dehydrogenase YagR molybdenum-binding subunit